MNSQDFPYEYGSDLHWLWGWGHRIDSLQTSDTYTPGEHDWMIFRPDQLASDAMTKFGIRYPTVIAEIKEELKSTNEAFSDLLKNPSEHTEYGLAACMEVLSHRIRVAAEAIAECEPKATGKLEANTPPVAFERKNGKTESKAENGVRIPRNLDVIRLAQIIKGNKDQGETKNSLALQFTEGDKSKADNLLRQLRGYRHLLE